MSVGLTEDRGGAVCVVEAEIAALALRQRHLLAVARGGALRADGLATTAVEARARGALPRRWQWWRGHVAEAAGVGADPARQAKLCETASNVVWTTCQQVHKATNRKMST